MLVRRSCTWESDSGLTARKRHMSCLSHRPCCPLCACFCYPPPQWGGLDLDSRSSGCARLGGGVGPLLLFCCFFFFLNEIKTMKLARAPPLPPLVSPPPTPFDRPGALSTRAPNKAHGPSISTCLSAIDRPAHCPLTVVYIYSKEGALTKQPDVFHLI